ncbi:PRD domain-containing protein [Clostridium sp. AN503]|uniref:PRD domain-containing protein n=1 Tax=Clostridium sp. AN503 TaxID=3160598 RepID=UPI0034582DF6
MYRVIKVLNNNGILVFDMQREEEAILLGSGVGFGKRINERFELKETDAVKRYAIVGREEKNRTGRQVIGGVEPVYLETAGRIVDAGRQALGEMNPNILIPLADHIAFAAKRVKSGVVLDNPLHAAIQILYPEEYQAALAAREIIREMADCLLPETEVGYIALHLRAGRMDEKLEESLKTVSLLEKLTALVEERLGIDLDPHSFAYERFMAHLRYLVACIKNSDPISLDIDEYARTQFPDSYKIAIEACALMAQELQRDIPKEAVGHLGIHIERLRA